MRRSPLASTFFSMVVAAGIFAIATTNGRTCKSNEFSANPTRGQALIRFDNAKDWSSFLCVNEFLGSRAKYSFLIPTSYQIVLSQAAEYLSKLNGNFDRDSLHLNSIFSSKMLALLSTHWDDTSASLPGLFGKAGDVDPEDLDNADDSSTDSSADMSNEGTAAGEYTSPAWRLWEGTSPYFTDANSYGFDHFFGIGDSISQAFFPRENNGYHSYPEQTESAPQASQPTDYAYDADDQYSIHYDDAMENTTEDDGENTANSTGAEANETVVSTQSNPSSDLVGDPNSAVDSLKQYLGQYASFNSLTLENSWENQTFSYFNQPISLDPETIFLNTPATSSVEFGNGLYYTTSPNDSTMDSEKNNPQDSISDEGTTSAKSSSGTILNLMVGYFKDKANNWTGAFHHIARQISILREVF